MTLAEMNHLIIGSETACLGFTDEEGRPEIRRVFSTWHKGVGTHLISTNTSSEHVQKLLHNSAACLYFDNCKKFEGLSLKGKAIVHFDHVYKAMLWNEGDEKYYPAGVDDEDYCVIEFIADEGRFYRYDGKGDISKTEIENHDRNETFKHYTEFDH